jgi:hypothetical protein
MSDVEYSLQYESTYKADIPYDKKEILLQFVNLICDYFNYIESKSDYVKVRGLETIFHVFHTVLSFTKNLPASLFHAKKAYYLYTEFTDQIAEDANLVLQLSSRDAVLYVYKKTLYELNNEFVKKGRDTLELIFPNLTLIKCVAVLFFQKLEKEEFKKWLQKLSASLFEKKECDIIFSLIDEDSFHENFLNIIKKMTKLKQQNIPIEKDKLLAG